MPSIFDGLEEIVDQFLHLDESWAGQPPRYKHRSTLQRLCEVGSRDIDGKELVSSLYQRILSNWDAGSETSRLPSEENWRFEKRLGVSDANTSSETILERTISRVCDENWANQVPVDSGLLGGRAHWIDLVYRTGETFSFIELKHESNTPLSAAIQILGYGLVYAFTRSKAEDLDVNLNRSPVLGATAINLRVLAPHAFYSEYGRNLNWLKTFEDVIHAGVEEFSRKDLNSRFSMTFGFEAFPADFKWDHESARETSTQKDVLWAVHRRQPVFSDEK